MDAVSVVSELSESPTLSVPYPIHSQQITGRWRPIAKNSNLLTVIELICNIDYLCGVIRAATPVAARTSAGPVSIPPPSL